MIGTTTKKKTKSAFNALPWQQKPWRDKSLILLMDGPAGTGKSHLAAYKLDAFMRKYPGSTGLMIRKTRKSMTNSTLLFFNSVVLKGDSTVTWKRTDGRFEYANGSILAYGGMKDAEQREAIRSIGQEGGIDIAWAEEANRLTLNDYEEILPRLRGRAAPWHQFILTCNPDTDAHWIYKRLILGGEASRYVAMTKDNTYNPDSYVDLILSQLTGVRYQRMVEGRWVSAEGAVYDDYRYEVHVIEPFEIPRSWLRFRSIDLGFRNPFVCQWWAVSPDDRMYMYREIYYTERLVEDHARQIVELSKDENIAFTVADHDAEDRATLDRYGVPTIPAQKDVSAGIQAVQSRMRIDGSGKPAIYFFQEATVEIDPKLANAKKPVNTIDEITGYVWEPSKEGLIQKERPVKLDDHGQDAMRYAVMSIDREEQIDWESEIA